ncbi:MAG: M24 family metallopeptidase, partial [Firmicutes bacterium]|nr:M24 family metallopeptidase [Bacillota bacterium]
MGFEADHLTYAEWQRWRDRAEKVQWVPTHHAVENLRRIKDREEIAAMKRAAAIAETALQEVLQQSWPGRTSAELALALESALRRAGGERLAFDTIVAAG